MHTRFRAKGLALAALLALLVLPSALLALPKPGQPGRGFRLAARAIGAITINRVYCGLASSGEVCVDSTNSPSIGGGFWPKGSPMQYVFNSGLQMAGVVDSSIAGFGWAGDTTGAMFFNARGDGHGNQVEPVWNSSNPDDAANWPIYARVPKGIAAGGDAQGDLFDPTLQGAVSASEGDVWTMAWDGDPSSVTGRPHPLGVAVETRGLGWNFPSGNGDVVYFIYTFYNITSSDINDYATVRPELRGKLAALGATFQATNNATFNVTIPTNGYTIQNFYANIAADMDVADAGVNYASVNLPFALGYTYEQNFSPPPGTYALPPDIGGAPFTGGFGFVGIKYLRTPIDPGTGLELGIRVFSNTINATGAFNDPRDVQALFRFLKGEPNTGLGDGNCNTGTVTVTHICYIENGNAQDMRFFQSSGPFDLPAGHGTSIVVGYLFASPVSVAGCARAGCGGAIIKPQDATRLSDPVRLASGANLIDSLTGFLKWTDGGNGVVEQSEFTVVKGSLLGKALTAQAVFDGRFLLPAAPAAPEFFVIPQDNQVTVVWRPTASEAAGDAYYFAAKDPKKLVDPDGAGPLPPALVNNSLYDPNYRHFDVEGYRIYRGRVDDPRSLTQLASFDYATTTFRDYLGVVNANNTCAPELRVAGVPIRSGCDEVFDTVSPGGTYTVFHDFPLSSPFVQVKLGNRLALANGTAVTLIADTAITGGDAVAHGTALTDGDIPFVYIDKTAKNNIRYFYSVTAFDVNSVQSGPTSLESSRVTKPVTPVHTPTNYNPSVTTTLNVRGRGVLLDPNAPVPALNATTGTFAGPMPAADGTALGLVGSFVKEVVAGSGQFFARLDSLKLGQIDLTGCCGQGGPGVPAHYYYTASNGSSSTAIDVVLTQDYVGPVTGQGLFSGIKVNNSYGSRYGGNSSFSLLAAVKPEIQPVGFAGGAGQAMILGEPGFTSADFGTSGNRYDGFRWFDGANETAADPTAGNCQTAGLTAACGAFGATQPVGITNYSNAGSVTGAGLVYMPHAGLMINREWRNMEAIMGGAVRAADIRVYWGAPGVVDSVIDLTHNVPLTFDSAGGTDANEELGAGWAILNQSATTAAGSYDGRPGTLTPLDWTCVKPFTTYIVAGEGFFPCAPGTEYAVSRTASLGPVAVGAGDQQLTGAADVNSVRSPNNNNGGNGFSMWVAGTISFFGGMAALPTNTTWTLRTYSGVIYGGGAGCASCNSGAHGSYSFNSQPRPMTAVGAEVVFGYNVAQTVTATTESDLERVHTVPDPYYVQNGYERTASGKIIKFTNLPTQAIVRIYSTSGVLVRVLEHNSTNFGSELDWDVRNRNNQVVASGVYFYAIETPSGARRVGRMTIVNFAQ